MNVIEEENTPHKGVGHPIRGARAELTPRDHMVQRLQVGIAGLASMVLLVALASIIMQRAKETEANTVPEAAATVAAEDDRRSRDPLADAGVVPDIPQSEGADTEEVVIEPLDEDLLRD